MRTIIVSVRIRGTAQGDTSESGGFWVLMGSNVIYKWVCGDANGTEQSVYNLFFQASSRSGKIPVSNLSYDLLFKNCITF